jgi:hypothetical protein
MEETKNAILDYKNAVNKLKKLRVLTNQKDFTGQIGEWVASIIYNGERAASGKQKGWDFISDEKKYQVKAAAKSNSNKTSGFTPFKKYINHKTFDYLIIIDFTEDYMLNSLYKIPYNNALVIANESKSVSKNILRSKISNYKMDLQEIKKQHQILSVFFD